MLSAHLDHLGVGAGQGSDRIFNGAMDNASGIATMIEVARTLRDKPLRRSVLFLAVTGEEGGLNGSKFFAAYPTVPARRMVADINVDMFLPIIPLRAITVCGLDESDLGELFAHAALQAGIRAERDPEPQRNIFIRSDQYSFIRRGVPALALKFHAYPDTPEAQVLRNWLRERYHAVSDDVSQPVDINAAEKFNAIVTACIEAVANRPEPPRWKAESFFRRYAH